jgi:hypothetical protein
MGLHCRRRRRVTSDLERMFSLIRVLCRFESLTPFPWVSYLVVEKEGNHALKTQVAEAKALAVDGVDLRVWEGRAGSRAR